MKQFASVVAGACAAFSVIVATTTPLKAQVPRQISYQGVLTDAVTGKPFTGKHVVTIKLYDAPLAVKPLWVEEHLAGIENGLFNLTLGAKVPLTLAFDRPYFIGVSVDGKPEFARVPLASAPYALQAAEAQSLAPTATGAVRSLNGQAGELSLVGSNGIKVESDGGLFRLEFDPKSLKKGEGLLVPPDGPAGGDLSGNYPNPTIGTAKVTNAKLADNIISTAKVIDGAITSAKIADGTIVSADISNGSITTDDIGSGAVRTGNILDATITTADLANGAVQTQIIATDAVRTDKIMDLNVTAPKLADGAVTTTKLANLAVTSAKLGDGSVTTLKIANDAVTGDKLADNSVGSNHIVNGGIQSIDLADNSVVTPKIADRAVNGRKLWTTGASEGYVITFNGVDAVWGPGSGGSVTTVPTPVCQNAFVRFNNTAGTQITQGALILEDVTEDNIVPIRANVCSEEGGRLGIALVTRDGGALQASTWGDTRGYNAIDWQMERYDDYEVAGGDYSVIGGGLYNAIIPGFGEGESYGGYAAVIGGGTDNYIEGDQTDYAVIGGGSYNYIHAQNGGGDGSTIGGGLDNLIEGDNTHGSFIGGGEFNSIGEGINFEGFGGAWSVITGGVNNTIGDGTGIKPTRGDANGPVAFGFIGGGAGNGIYSASGQNPGDNSHFSAVAGGESNEIVGVSHHSFIGGGGYNIIENEGEGEGKGESFFSTIGGGHQNSISSNFGFIGGGQGNSVSGEGAIVVGGGYIYDGEGVSYHGNSANGDFSFIGGGADNLIGSDAQYSSIIGGSNNSIGGNETNSRYSVILGGRGLRTYGDGSLGFLGGNADGSHDMEVTASNTALLGNVDVWLANNDNDARELRFYTPNSIGSGVFPHSEVGYTGFVAPNTIQNGAGYQMYSLPQDVPGVGQVLKVTSIGGGDVALEWANDNNPTLQYFAESQSAVSPNDTRYVSTWSAIGGASDIDVALSPKGNGALTAQTADNATTGGNKRGPFAVDWQLSRTFPTQVASGNYSTVSGGQINTAGGNNSTVGGGEANTTNGSWTTVGGGRLNSADDEYNTIPGGVGLTLSGVRSFGFHANRSDGSGGNDRDMTVADYNAAVFGNVDMWLANNDGTTRSLRFYTSYDGAGAFPTTALFSGFMAPNTMAGGDNIVYRLPEVEPADGQFLRATNITGNGSGNMTVELDWENTGLQFFTESQNSTGINGSRFVSALTAIGSASDIDIALTPKGSGALTAQTADGATTGGDKRGGNATDWQTLRSNANQVASGFYSTISGGHENRASATESTIGGGIGNTASNTAATVAGGAYNTASGFLSAVGGGTVNTAGSYSAIPGGVALALGARSFGYNANHDSSNYNVRPMSISASNTAVFNNVDLWLSTNENISRSMRFYTPYNEPNGFPGTAKYSGFMAPNTMNGGDNIVYRLPQVEPTNGQFLRATNITGNGSGDMTVELDWEAASGGSTLQYFAESQSTSAPNDTRYVSTWTAVGAGATDIDIALSPKGDGALTAQTADDATTGGEKRGALSVDWQMFRTNANQVAAGDYSVIAGGANNRADGVATAVLGGTGNTIYFDAENSVILGGSSNVIGGDESGSDYSAILGGNGLSLIGEGSVGFHANHPDGSGGYDRNMDIESSHTAVFGNVDMWLASNDGTNRELRFYAQHNAAGAFPGTTNYTGFVAPTTLPATNNVIYTLPAIEPTNGQFLRAVNVNSANGNTTADLEWANSSGGSGALVYSTNDTYTSSPLNGDTDDLSISNTATYFRVDATATIDLTGIIASGSPDGRVIYITNTNLFNSIILKDDDVSSSAPANRFRLAEDNDVIIGPDLTVGLIYDGSISRWRVLTN